MLEYLMQWYYSWGEGQGRTLSYPGLRYTNSKAWLALRITHVVVSRPRLTSSTQFVVAAQAMSGLSVNRGSRKYSAPARGWRIHTLSI
jgi:hypothetical protein